MPETFAARLLKNRNIPVRSGILRSRLEAELGRKGKRELTKVLGFLEGHILICCEEVHTAWSGNHVERGGRRLENARVPAEGPIGLFSLVGHPGSKLERVEQPDVLVNQSLLMGD